MDENGLSKIGGTTTSLACHYHPYSIVVKVYLNILFSVSFCSGVYKAIDIHNV